MIPLDTTNITVSLMTAEERLQAGIRASLALVGARGGTVLVTGGIVVMDGSTPMEIGYIGGFRYIESTPLEIEPSVNWPAPVAPEHQKPLKRAVLGPRRARWA